MPPRNLLHLNRAWRDLHAPDPGSWANIFEPNNSSCSLESLAKYACLFLIGRPGAGKSSEVTRIQQGEVEGFNQEWPVLIPYREVGSDLRADIERDSHWKSAWSPSQSKPVRLIIDGLDEGFLRESHFYERLKRVLSGLKSEHPGLRLLLTCRPGERDLAFEEAIHQAWQGVGPPSVFSLEPLSEPNRKALSILYAVRDPDSFSEWIARNKFHEFARWPRLLQWLANEFNFDGGRNVSFTRLCQNRVFRGFGEEGRILKANRPSQESEIWGQALMLVAAILVFCGYKGISVEERAEGCLSLDDILQKGGVIEMPGKPKFTREVLRAALEKSHLIERSPKGCFHFQNQSDLEFLAAAMLGSLRDEQLQELFGGFDSAGQWRVFPQLQTAAANLAARSEKETFFDLLLDKDPRVLLRADFASQSAQRKRATLEAILVATAEASSTGKQGEQAFYSTLSYPGIEAQLAQWLFDEKQPVVARDLAFDIAQVCCGEQFWEQYWEKYSGSGDQFLERRLLRVIGLAEKSWPEDRLASLAKDPQNGIAAAAMFALLHRGWKARAVLPFLREPQPNLLDYYSIFLGRLGQYCGPEDIPEFLEWAGQSPTIASDLGEIRKLAKELVGKAVRSLEQLPVLDSLVKFLVERYLDNDPFLGHSERSQAEEFGLEEPGKRRELIRAFASAWPSDQPLWFNLPLFDEDLPWILDQVALADGNEARFFAKMVSQRVWRIYREHGAALERAYSVSQDLRAQLPPADLEGICATLARLQREGEERHQSHVAELERNYQRPVFDGQAYLRAALESCRAGMHSFWPSLCFALSSPKNQRDTGTFCNGTDIRQLEGWQNAPEELRRELPRFARDFLLNGPFQMPGPRQIPEVFFGIVYALSLLIEGLEQDDELRSKISPVWALALLRHCGSDDEPLAAPLAVLTRLAPGAVAEAFELEVSEQWERNGPIFGSLLPFAFSDETGQKLEEVLKRNPLQPESYLSGLKLMGSLDAPRAERVASERLNEFKQRSEGPERRAALAACCFVVPDLWRNAWPLISAQEDAARAFLVESFNWLDYNEIVERLDQMDPALLASLWGLSLKCLDPEKRPTREGDGFQTISPLENAYHVQNKLLQALEARGCRSELMEVYDLNPRWKNSPGARASLDRATRSQMIRNRQIPTPAEFIRFLQTEGGVFVCDNDSLQRAVIVSLLHFEAWIKPNPVKLLWSQNKKAGSQKITPRSEEDLQIMISEHLARDLKLVVVNMETKVEGHERSDIRVEALSENQRLAVTLEVKMGHSKDSKRPLRSAMKTQLLAYLNKKKETHGIYVVGWFFCDSFRPSALTNLKTISAARKYFDNQASSLSNENHSLKAAVIDCSLPQPVARRVTPQRVRN